MHYGDWAACGRISDAHSTLLLVRGYMRSAGEMDGKLSMQRGPMLVTVPVAAVSGTHRIFQAVFARIPSEHAGKGES
jgi:hypothetical protein